MALVYTLPKETYDDAVVRLRINDPACLAPGFRRRVDRALEACSIYGLDAIVFETSRTDELAKLYFEHKVSNAPNALHTWHHYGLAVDVSSKSKEWGPWESADQFWEKGVLQSFTEAGCDWGGYWKSIKDKPHFQFGGLPASPQAIHISTFQDHGLGAVWDLVGATR